MLVDSTSIPLRNLQSNPPASSHGVMLNSDKCKELRISFVIIQPEF